MSLFGARASGETREQRDRQEASQRSLEQGGLPLNAVDRLRAQAARQGTPGQLFTSDLSVNELALTRETGYEPLGQVMGSSVYHVGWQWMPMSSWSSGELTVMTEAFYQARHRALDRLRQEAQLLGATGVVGVHLEHKEYEWGPAMLEFAAIGTAIRETTAVGQGAPGTSDAAPTPFLSDLSGQDFWKLRQAGFRPVGIAIGNCSYYQVPTWNTRSVTQGSLFFGGWVNQELPDYTQALYNARGLAMERMSREARAAGAQGVVGVTVDVDVTPIERGSERNRRIDMLYHFTAIGTAIAPTAAPPPSAGGPAALGRLTFMPTVALK